MAEGGLEERYGPFETYTAAKKEWARRSAAGADNLKVRFFIRKQEEGAPRHLSC